MNFLTVVSEHPEMSRRLLLEEYESECKLKDIADSITRPRHRRMTSPAVSPPPGKANINQEPTHDIDTSTHKQVSVCDVRKYVECMYNTKRIHCASQF